MGRGVTKVTFFCKGGIEVDIESAIETCEVKPCMEKELPTNDKIQQLKTLKELLDQGVLTEEEFKIEKQKLLNN